MTIKTRILLAIVSIGIIPLVCASAVVMYATSNEVNVALDDAASAKLIAVREMKKDQLVSYISDLKSLVKSIAETEQTVVATGYFSSSFDLNKKVDAEQQQNLSSFYDSVFAGAFKQHDPGFNSADAGNAQAALDDPGRYFQMRYISSNPNPLGAKQALDQAKKITKFNARYDLYHSQYHPGLRRLQEEFGFPDVLIVSPEGRVVYSVAKNVDYATDLTTGSDSGLVQAWNAAKDAAAGQVFLTDINTYFADFGTPAAFLSAPVFEKDKNVGTLVVRLPVERVTLALTSNKHWADVGLGKSGEVYLVGDDERLRTDSRRLIEAPEQYLNEITLTGWQDSIEQIQNRRTGVALQIVSSDSVKAALKGGAGVIRSQGYYGEEVLSAYTSVDIDGLRWALISEMSSSEAFASEEQILGSITRTSGIVVLVVLVAAVLFGLLLSRLLVNPLRELVTSFQEIAEGDGDLTTQLESAKRKDEIGELATAFNAFVANIRGVVAQASETAESLTAVTNQLAQQSGDTASRMGQQRSMSELIVTAMTEFSYSIDHVAQSSNETLNAMVTAGEKMISGADNAQRSVDEIDQLVGFTRESANSINALSGEIDQVSSILDVINDIAKQTSLLALNAAIEAARAGEQGRGFAVVADEVRTLSSRTQEATVNIQETMEKLRETADDSVRRVENSMDNAERGIAMVNETASELDETKRLMADVEAMQTQIATAVNEQLDVIKDIEKNAVEIDTLSETTLDSAQESAGDTDKLSQMADRLHNLVGRFKT